MAYQHYKELDVYQLAYKLAIGLHKVTLEFPQIEQYAGVADQIRRASRSVCANIAEGFGKASSKAEEKRFLSMARGSAEEMGMWLDFVRDLGYADPEKIAIWQTKYDDVRKMLYSLMQKRTQRGTRTSNQ